MHAVHCVDMPRAASPLLIQDENSLSAALLALQGRGRPMTNMKPLVVFSSIASRLYGRERVLMLTADGRQPPAGV